MGAQQRQRVATSPSDGGQLGKDLRRSFVTRFVLSTALTLVAVLASTAFFTAREARDAAERAATERHAARTDVLADALAVPVRDDGLSTETRVAVDVFAREVDVEFAGLLAGDGTILASNIGLLEGFRFPFEVVPFALPEPGEVTVETIGTTELLSMGQLDVSDVPGLDHDATELTLSIATMDVDGSTYWFVVATDAELLGFQIDTVVRSMAVSGLLGLLVTVPVAYLLGGRSLLRRYLASERRSARDGLTGVGNHRAFQEALAGEVRRAARHGHAISLLLVDIDDFKTLNDTHGHRAGDDALVAVAEVLDGVRGTDQAFRIGGDEFAVLAQTEMSGAAVLAERLRGAVELLDHPVTISIGIATASDAADVDALRDEADAALYDAKARGRNRVVGARTPVA